MKADPEHRSIAGIRRPASELPRTVQISLDVSTIDEALQIAKIAARAGVDNILAVMRGERPPGLVNTDLVGVHSSVGHR